MNEPPTVDLNGSNNDNEIPTTTTTGKALAFAHAVREGYKQTADESPLVSVVDGTVIHATTERLLNLQKQIMKKNDHMFNATFDLEPLYNSDEEDEEKEDDDDDVEDEGSNTGDNDGEKDVSSEPTRRDQAFAAAQAEASELIDICFGACDASGRILKFPSPASFGRGVYTSNTPFSPIFFSQAEAKFKLLLMARLKGKTEYIRHATTKGDTMIRGQADSAVLVTPGTADEICILRRSSQCIPLLVVCQDQNSGSPVLDSDDDNAVGNDIIHRHVCMLQRLVDQLLHDTDRHSSSIPQRVLPSEVKGSAGQLDISSFQVANRSLAPAMKRWSLRTAVCYNAPETIDETAFCIPTAEKLEQFLSEQTNKTTSKSKAANAKCALCLTKGGNVNFLPKCRHAFHIKCLVRRWSKGKCFQCPTCNVPIQYRETALLDLVEKDQALIMNFCIGDDSHMKEAKDAAYRHCQSPTLVVSAIVPTLNEVLSPTSAENALTIQYDCGSSFKLKLAAPPKRRSTTAAEQWSNQFHDPMFLPQIQNRVKTHNSKCTVCQRRQEGRLRSNLLRHIVPRHAANENDGKGARVFIGTMPSGTMRIDEFPELSCSGHSPGIFSIKYNFAEDVQKPYHKKPGVPYVETYCEAFLPNSPAGKQLLERLILAFSYGLTFTVGTSTSASKRNVIKWSTIPHKTSLSPGQYGYPDHSYFDAANAELDALGVPTVSGSH